ncbi:hypothetical protein [Komagataeibacter sp. FXV3]|uniref:hypothetical protein n=1 Tax=Komagataeibacter sp. FXV3 TaxID=2608998 RepID=UPI00187B50C7|nr:hypothetical protein [Komagataeibacter sp. FXV3]MBE7728669.1 hypothetical protein [Komagataeibacter sp. FXV3]
MTWQRGMMRSMAHCGHHVPRIKPVAGRQVASGPQRAAGGRLFVMVCGLYGLVDIVYVGGGRPGIVLRP